MKKFSLLAIGMFSLISMANAQTDEDALRYSMIGFGGTARYSGMGGAFGAIGADFSTLSENPAGLGVYRKNEFTFTPSIFTGKTTATYNGSTSDDMKYNFNLGNIGLVYAKSTNKAKDEPGWKYVNFAFGLNRYNNFNNRMVIQGTNTSSSLMDVYAANAHGSNPGSLDAFSTLLAYNTNLLGTLDSVNYNSNVPLGSLLQHKSVETHGSMQEMVLSLAANYNNKLYIGGTLGISFLRYDEQSTYQEDNKDSTNSFQSFTLNSDLNTSGTGYNFKFGLLYVPVDMDILKVKIGAAVHTPTFYTMHDEWSSTMNSSFTSGDYSYESPKGSFDYELTTPMKAIGSLALQFGQYGTISADYEFVDYSDARLRSRSYDFLNENYVIQNKYTATHNLRFGAEVALGLFSLRGGYDIYGSPFKSGINDGKVTSITGGFGIMDKNYFIDFAYVHSTSKADYYLYNFSNMNPASTDKTTQSFLLTLGYKF